MKLQLSFKRIILAVLFIIILILIRPCGFLIYTYYKDEKSASTLKPGYVNDASNLNQTRVSSIIEISKEQEQAEQQIVQLVKKASTEGKKISIAGAQHSMGGHTIYPDAIVLDMKNFNGVVLDSVKNVVTVGSGALWAEVIPFLDARGMSVAVMQSNNSFTIGGSISVNCHGWQVNAPPIASTVESFRLITGTGEVISCSRSENQELFSLVLGGYGLFGVILDVKLKVVDNKVYELQQTIFESKDYIRKFDELVNAQKNVEMAYGRININSKNFLEEAILSVFKIHDDQSPQPLNKRTYKSLRRTVFRGSVNSKYGKELRWKAEKLFVRFGNGGRFSRNQLLNEGVEVLQNTTSGYTYLLHEYFIPKPAVTDFIASLKKILPAYKSDLLNITIRNVKKDNDTFLRYANEEVFGFVMLFNHSMNPSAENEMQALTQKLIDVSLSLKGTYYLPYRLHATKEQFYKCYPVAKEFFILKKEYDPNEIFQNNFYNTFK